MFLCCDLGGTKADWGVFDPESVEFVFSTSLDVAEYEDFYEMLDSFLADYDGLVGGSKKIENTTFAIAGPTDHTKVRVTNIEGWEINTLTTNAILSDHGHTPFSSIINDFEALGYGILHMMDVGFEKDDFVHLHGRYRFGPARTGEEVGTRSLICGPGTGLGVACVVENLQMDGYPYIISSEGGHHSIAPENSAQYRFLSRQDEFTGKVSYEEALSHRGLQHIYNYFRREDYSAEPNYGIFSSEIIQLANNGNDQAATDAVELFCEFLANFCGNLVLTFNCDKAVYLWGGTLSDISRDLLTARFKRHYSDRCSHSGRVSRLPVVLLERKDIPLLGCVHRSKFEVPDDEA